jgi:glycosyltransferase involved in cell wall biosynthesis
MDDITTFLTRKNYYDGTLVNSPVPNKLAVDPICIYLKDFNTIPEFSVVVPIHNQEKIIVTNLNSILYHMDGTFELILIIDSSTDTTLETILEWIETVNCSSLTKLMVILSVTPLFETAADNIGFRLASAPLIMEIQADMRMTEKGFNRVLERPFIKYENVIGVSGRCAHNFIQTNGIGKLGELVEKPYNPALSQNKFYIFGTCNRGPLLLQKDKLKELGYLDETNYFLDNSDHDLFARAFVQKSWVCGYVPIEFASPIADGSTRKPRDTLNQMIYNEYKETKKGGFLIEYLQSAPQFNQPMILPC